MRQERLSRIFGAISLAVLVVYPAVSGAHECVNVRLFGARGDGRTDDQPAIQAAIDSLDHPSAEIGAVGTVCFPPGRYRINRPIQLPETNGNMAIRLLGSGYDTAIINRNLIPDQPAIQAGSARRGFERASGFEIGHLAIIGNRAGVPAPGIRIIQAQWSYLHDLWIMAAGTGVEVRGFLGSTMERVHIWPGPGKRIYVRETPNQRTAGIGFDFFSDRSIPDPNLVISLRDITVNGGTDAFVFGRGPGGVMRDVMIEGGFVQRISGDVFAIAEVDNFRISNFRVEGIDRAAQRFIKAQGADFLTIENVRAIGDIVLINCERVSVQNTSLGGRLDFVDATSARGFDFMAINFLSRGGVNPPNAFDLMKSWLIVGPAIAGNQGIMVRGIRVP